jgi:hypothetical protein
MISILAATIASCSSDDDNNPATPVGWVITSLTNADYSATDLEIVLGLTFHYQLVNILEWVTVVYLKLVLLAIAPGTAFRNSSGGTNVYLAVERNEINASGTSTVKFTSFKVIKIQVTGVVY